MNKFFILQLPVYGRIGERSVWDNSGTHPTIHKLHYVLDYEPDSELFQTFPVFIVSRRLSESFKNSGFSGFEIRPMDFDLSEDFHKLHPNYNEDLAYSWLKVNGHPCIDDFGMNIHSNLVVSKRVFEHLQNFKFKEFLKYDADAPPNPQQIENDLFEMAKKAVRESRKSRGEE